MKKCGNLFSSPHLSSSSFRIALKCRLLYKFISGFYVSNNSTILEHLSWGVVCVKEKNNVVALAIIHRSRHSDRHLFAGHANINSEIEDKEIGTECFPFEGAL